MLQFRIQSTPNPLARKYLLSQDLKKSGKVSYQDQNACDHVPLARELLSLSGVRQIHFFENILTITQDGTLEWTSLDQEVQHIVMQKIDEHDIDFIDFLESEKPRAVPLSPELKKIDSILESTIRPSLQMDGGDLELLDLEGNILTIKYMGACGGCPSSMTGTLAAIRSILEDQYRSDIEVVAI